MPIHGRWDRRCRCLCMPERLKGRPRKHRRPKKSIRMERNIMIIIQVAGGLGNQLQQYALYRKLIRLGKEVRLDL